MTEVAASWAIGRGPLAPSAMRAVSLGAGDSPYLSRKRRSSNNYDSYLNGRRMSSEATTSAAAAAVAGFPSVGASSSTERAGFGAKQYEAVREERDAAAISTQQRFGRRGSRSMYTSRGGYSGALDAAHTFSMGMRNNSSGMHHSSSSAPSAAAAPTTNNTTALTMPWARAAVRLTTNGFSSANRTLSAALSDSATAAAAAVDSANSTAAATDSTSGASLLLHAERQQQQQQQQQQQPSTALSRYNRSREREHRLEGRTARVQRTRSHGQAVPLHRLPSIGGKDHSPIKHMNAHGSAKLVAVSESTAEGSTGVCTIQGLKPGNPRWENQDNYVMEECMLANSTTAHNSSSSSSSSSPGGSSAVSQQQQQAVRYFAVLDGHGELGHLVTRRCKEQLPRYMAACGLQSARACSAMHEDLATSGHVDCACSGATCVTATIHSSGSGSGSSSSSTNNSSRRVTVANLGDSRCVLGRRTSGHSPQLCAVPLSSDHKPDRADERARILAMGGQTGSRQLVVGSGPNGPIRIPMGPARVWYQVCTQLTICNTAYFTSKLGCVVCIV
jgi:serine/threonine protein phosphatase PrpC